MARKKKEAPKSKFRIGELVSLAGTPFKYYITSEKDGKFGLGNKTYSEPFRMVRPDEIVKLEEEEVELIPEIIESEEDVPVEECADDGDEFVL